MPPVIRARTRFQARAPRTPLRQIQPPAYQPRPTPAAPRRSLRSAPSILLQRVRTGRIRRPRRHPHARLQPQPQPRHEPDNFRYPPGPWINHYPDLFCEQMSTPRFNSAWFRESISLSLTHDFATLRLVRKISTRPLEFGNAAAFWAAWWTKFQLVFIVIHDIEGEGVEVWDELMALQCAQNAARFELVKCVDENWEPREVMRPGPEEEGWCRVTERAMLEEDEKVMELCEGVRGYRVLLWEGRESHMRRLERARRILDDGVSDGLSMMSVSSVSSRSSESSSC